MLIAAHVTEFNGRRVTTKPSPESFRSSRVRARLAGNCRGKRTFHCQI